MAEKKGGLPAMTPEQRAAALEKAKEARLRRAELKAGLADGSVKMSQILESEDQAAKRMKVSDAVAAMPGYGAVKVDALLSDLGIAEGRRLGGLGQRQRAALIEIFG